MASVVNAPEKATPGRMGRWAVPWQAGLGAAWLVGLWWVGRNQPAPSAHAHEAASALAALAVGAAVMAMPCVLQMSAVCVALLAGAPLDDIAEGVRRRGRPRLLGALGLFGLGYLGVLVGASGIFGLGVWLLGPKSVVPVLEAAGIAALGLLGLALLGALPFPGRPCAGPLGFLRRVPGTSPVPLGAAFAVYCAACCGPMLVPLAALGGPSPFRTAALAAAFSAGAGLPFLLAVVSFGWAVRTADFLAAHPLAWRRACGAAVLAMALLSILTRP